MPLYEYECDACGRRFELIRRFSDPPLEVCDVCGKGPIHRLPSSPAIQFKGSGWYITDYAKKGKGDSSGTSSGDKPADAKTDGAPKDAKGGGAGETASDAKSSNAKREGTSEAPAKPAAPSKE